MRFASRYIHNLQCMFQAKKNSKSTKVLYRSSFVLINVQYVYFSRLFEIDYYLMRVTSLIYIYFSVNREWDKEVERASRRKRKPRLRNAIFRMFVPNFIVDGLECLTFILIR